MSKPAGGVSLGISLYRRYRPQKFSEVTGQKTAVDVIVRSLERSRIGHAYLFSGPRGCGKTTVARLLAKALNCLSPVKGENGDGKNVSGEFMACEPCCECKNCLAIAAGESLDVIEIDGASNNSVDEVRELKSHVTLAPFSSLYKVYIVDEVHMLSISAFNALLKTLEEPPAYVVFILATTEAHKVPVTIRSRCQHIPFHRIGARDIYDRLVYVCAEESLAYRTEALWEIARQADGALRDALSMLEQVANLGRSEIALSDVETTLGQGSRPSLERWISGWREGEAETFLELDRMLAGGASPQRFCEELFSLVRNLWLTARWNGVLAALDASEQEKEYLKTEAPLWEPWELVSVMDFLSELLPQVRLGLRADVLSGLLMARMVRLKEGGDLKEGGEAARKESQPASPASRVRERAVESVRKAPAPSGGKAAEEVRPEAAAPKENALPKTPSASEWTPVSDNLPPPENPLTSKNVSAPQTSGPPPFSPGRECPKERWDAALEALREKEFVLYCALLGADPFQSERKAEAGSNKEDSNTKDSNAETGEAVLILDIASRYCYEVLRLDRNRAFLKNGLEPFSEGAEVVLRHGDLWISCRDAARPSAENVRKVSGRRSASKRESSPGDPVPAEKPETDEAEEAKRTEGPRGARAEEVPFGGLIEEVSRWLRGDVVLVRRGGEEDGDDDMEEDILSGGRLTEESE